MGAMRRRRTRTATLAVLAAGAVTAGLLTVPAVAGPVSSTDTGSAGSRSVPADLDARVAAATAQLDSLAADLMKRSGIPGMSLAVVYKGRMIKAAGYGVRDVDTGAPVTPDTVFQLASLSKSVAASVAAAAIGKGYVRWDDPVVKHLPWFRLSDPMVTKKVTIGDLYAMRSGLPGQAGDVLETVGFDRRQVLERIGTLPLDPFRITYNYTNFGITAGGEAVAAASGQSWEDLSEDLIYRPLGMDHTSSRYADFVKQPNRSALHVPVNGQWVSRYERHPDAQSPAGGVSSTALDMANWMIMELANGWYGGKQVVPSLALAKAHAPQIRSSAPGDAAALPRFYGYGTNYQVVSSGRVHLGHSGAFSAGAGTTYLLIPELDLGIVALSNGFAGLPEAVTQSFADLVEHGEITTDWLALVGGMFAGTYAPDPYVPPGDASAPRPDRAYVGTYANEYWGEVPVRSGRDGLYMVLGPDRVRVPLTPFDGDTFKGTLDHGDWPSTFLVTFTSDPGAGGSRITGMDVQLGPSQDGALTRLR